MKLIEQLACEVEKEISNSYQYFSLPQRQAIRALIVRKFEGVVPEPQPSFSFTDADEKANAAQCAAILALLKKRRGEGCTNVELAHICLKYTSRVSDLRLKDNYRIYCKRENGRVWRYNLDPLSW